MKLTIKGPLRENIYNLMRKAGYCFLRRDKQKNEFEFGRPPRSYPRFHLFMIVKNNNFIFNLHLDQKRPIYEGTPAHAGEYDSEVIKREAQRIKQILEEKF